MNLTIVTFLKMTSKARSPWRHIFKSLWKLITMQLYPARLSLKYQG